MNMQAASATKSLSKMSGDRGLDHNDEPGQGQVECQSLLRVLHIASGDEWAGQEVQVFQMVRALSHERDLDVQIVLLNEGRLADELRRAGVKVKVLDETRLGFLQLVKSLTDTLRSWPVQIIHTHRNKENLIGAFAAKIIGIPHLVCTIHGLWEQLPRGSYWRGKLSHWGNWVALRYLASHIIAVSSDIASCMEKVASGRVSVVGNSNSFNGIPSGYDPSSLRASLGIEPGHKIVGAVGRLAPVKGMDLFVECAVKLARARHDVSCLIVGEGPERARLEEMIAKSGVNGKIVLSGFRNDVLNILDLIDVLVIPSRYEGVPTVLLEALSLGKAVVATAVGGIPDVAEHNVNCLLVRPGEALAWVETILFLLDQPEEARRLGAHGKRDVAEKWSVARQSQHLTHIYRTLTGEALR